MKYFEGFSVFDNIKLLDRGHTEDTQRHRQNLIYPSDMTDVHFMLHDWK